MKRLVVVLCFARMFSSYNWQLKWFQFLHRPQHKDNDMGGPEGDLLEATEHADGEEVEGGLGEEMGGTYWSKDGFLRY